ncbi:MAG: N-acetylmuramoyl-L-alanine amidase CwlD [Firmicutes bacterium]|nr:N-acetylmuramoyl-L-alanine amidase CwlD [Bacillota bacterium]
MPKYQKYLVIFMFLLIILLFVIYPNVNAATKELPLFGKVIFVDPGHGGRDPGTMHGNILEKDITLEISKVLSEELGKNGAIVYMTRENDEDLSSKWDERKKRGDLYRRILMYKNNNADMYLSIHINHYKNSAWSGAEVLYYPINKENKIIGEILMNNFKTEFKTKRNLKTTDLYMYKNTTIPGVLIECGFLSNANERYLLQQSSYQLRLAKTITNSVIEYYEKKNKN